MSLEDRFTACFDALAAVGRRPGSGGWQRFAWTDEDAAARAWFRHESAVRGLSVEQDRNGNLWAWWGEPGPGAVVTGSHLDTVAAGGPFDGALGVVSGLLAVGELQQRGVAPDRPVAVAAFADEEGGRFGVATLGSRLSAGLIEPSAVLERRDEGGVPLAAALEAAGIDPAGIGADPDRLEAIAAFVELHIEQGRALADRGLALAVGTYVWPHGRWRLEARGEQNHAGTTRMADRRDPTHVLAAAVTAAARHAAQLDAVATVGRARISPNSTNSVPGEVHVWLDARAPDEPTLDELVEACSDDVSAAALQHRLDAVVTCESRSPAVRFDRRLRERLTERLERAGHPTTQLPTAAGHDAAALAARVPSTMLFVRNPTGSSHTPNEHADVADCVTGVAALADVLEELACG